MDGWCRNSPHRWKCLEKAGHVSKKWWHLRYTLEGWRNLSGRTDISSCHDKANNLFQTTKILDLNDDPNSLMSLTTSNNFCLLAIFHNLAYAISLKWKSGYVLPLVSSKLFIIWLLLTSSDSIAISPQQEHCILTIHLQFLAHAMIFYLWTFTPWIPFLLFFLKKFLVLLLDHFYISFYRTQFLYHFLGNNQVRSPSIYSLSTLYLS